MLELLISVKNWIEINLHLQTIFYCEITKYMCRIWCLLSPFEILWRSPSLRSCLVGLTSSRTFPNFFSTSNISLNFLVLFNASLECIAAFLIISRASVVIKRSLRKCSIFQFLINYFYQNINLLCKMLLLKTHYLK